MNAQTETEPFSPQEERAGIQEIVSEIGSEIGALLRNTLRLFSRESQEKVSYVIANLTKVIIAIGVALIGIGFLLASLNMLLVSLVSPELIPRDAAQWLGPLFIGSLTAATGFFLYKNGMKRVQRFDPKPQKTAESIERDKDWILEKTKGKP